MFKEKEKFSLVSNQLNQEKERTTTLQSETKSITEQLRKAEIAYEQLVCTQIERVGGNAQSHTEHKFGNFAAINAGQSTCSLLG